MSVIIETTLGDITIDLYLNERPRCCLNFLKLCKVKYYNYCLFHNVKRNFVAQTGDPTGTGRGGESIFRMIYGDQAKLFDAEKVPKINHKNIGLVSMVNDGNGFHGSQFLFTLGENLDSLDGMHTVFGEVAEGIEVIMKINEAFCDKNDRPYQDIRITHTIILDDPLDDPAGLEIPDKSPEPTDEQLEGCFRIGADEAINDDEGIDEKELVEREEKKEAAHSAQVLEIIGDIPDKDVKPPDNVLFVCKLNSITTDEDLEIIFSRFGTILSCEIIRDYKTGDSLQYAFIEFESADSCEKAYQKMDNVLIDDRRIHVDFSQSVSKLQFPKHHATKDNVGPNRDTRNQAGRDEQHSHKRQSNRGKDDEDRPRRRRESLSPQRSNRRDVTPPSHRRRRDDTPPKRHRYHRDDVSPPRDARRHRDVRDRSPERRHQERRYRSHENGHREKRSPQRHRPDDDVRKRRGDVDRRRDDTSPARHGRREQRRDVSPERNRQSREEKVSPPPKRHHEVTSSSGDESSGELERKAPAKRKKEMKTKKSKKAKKEKKKKRKKSSSSSDSHATSSDEEVRCGKHRKRSVSNHKDDIRRKAQKHRT